MGAESSPQTKPDSFLLKSGNLDSLFEELGMPLAGLGETVMKRHMEIIPIENKQPKSHQQQAAEYFGKSMFPSPLKP